MTWPFKHAHTRTLARARTHTRTHIHTHTHRGTMHHTRRHTSVHMHAHTVQYSTKNPHTRKFRQFKEKKKLFIKAQYGVFKLIAHVKTR